MFHGCVLEFISFYFDLLLIRFEFIFEGYYLYFKILVRPHNFNLSKI